MKNQTALALMILCFTSSTSFAQPYSKFLQQKQDGGTVKYYHIKDCDKDGAIVGKRVTSAMCGIGPSAICETRTAVINPANNLVGPTFFQRRADETVAYYQQAGLGNNPLLMNTNVVMGSVHEMGLHVAESLHAPFLPLGFIGWADTLARLKSAPGIVQVLSDYDVSSHLWVRSTPGKQSDIPASYIQVLSKADNLYIVRSTDMPPPSDYIGQYQGCYVHSSVLSDSAGPAVKSMVQQMMPTMKSIPDATRNALRQHEWGLPDATIQTMLSVWTSLGKSVANFHVIEGDTVSLFQAIPSLSLRYLNYNNRKAEGITLNSYWIDQSGYERRFNLIPFHFYRYKDVVNGWAPYDALIQSIVGGVWQNTSPFTVRSFANNIGTGSGPNSDVVQLYNFLGANNLGPNNPNIDSFYCIGVDCTGTVCTAIDGSVLDDLPSTKVRKYMAFRPDATADRSMKPLTSVLLCGLAEDLKILMKEIRGKK
jgi:hypothetical protein